MDLKFYQALELAINDHAIVAITDVKGTITFVNAKAEAITGFSKAELIGANHRVFNSGVHPVKFWKEMYRTVTRGKTWHNEVCNRAKDGNLYWVDTTISPMMGESGKLEGYISIRTDIAELKLTHAENERHAVELVITRELALQSEEKAKRAEELIAARNMIQEKEQSLQIILDSVSEGIFGVDINGYCTFVNRSFLQILGFNHENEVLGKYLHNLIHHTQKDRTPYPSNECKIYLSTQNNQPVRVDDEVFWKCDGTPIDVKYSTLPIVQDGVVTGNVATFEDISEKVRLNKEHKQHEKQMIQQSRLAQMGEMISMIAHQWRQPLAAMTSTIFNMKVKIELQTFDLDTPQGRDAAHHFFIETLNNVEEHIQGLSTTIDDFRNFHNHDKKITITSFKEVTHKALKIVRNSIKLDNIKLIEEYGDNITFQMIDNEIVQVILNIIKNAQDIFVEKNIQNPQIKITSRNNTLNLSDNGGGIPSSIIEKIFDPYFSTKNEKNGTGLGLYMSKTIIEDHHKGTLKLYNQNDGVCFSITLPNEMTSV